MTITGKQVRCLCLRDIDQPLSRVTRLVTTCHVSSSPRHLLTSLLITIVSVNVSFWRSQKAAASNVRHQPIRGRHGGVWPMRGQQGHMSAASGDVTKVSLIKPIIDHRQTHPRKITSTMTWAPINLALEFSVGGQITLKYLNLLYGLFCVYCFS